MDVWAPHSKSGCHPMEDARHLPLPGTNFSLEFSPNFSSLKLPYLKTSVVPGEMMVGRRLFSFWTGPFSGDICSIFLGGCSFHPKTNTATSRWFFVSFLAPRDSHVQKNNTWLCLFKKSQVSNQAKGLQSRTVNLLSQRTIEWKFTLYFYTKYVTPKSLKVSHWLSQWRVGVFGKFWG